MTTEFATEKITVYKNGRYARVKMGYSERVYSKASKKYEALEEIGFSAQKMDKYEGLYIIVAGIWFTATPSNKDGGIELNYKAISRNGLTDSTYEFKQAKSKGLHDLARSYLLEVQHFKTMKYATIYNKYKEAIKNK